MAKNSTDKEERHFAQSGVTVSGEERFPIFPKRHVGVHARTVIAVKRLRHEGDSFVVFLRHVAHDVFVILQVVRHRFHRGETDVDFRLTRGRDFMMLALDRDSGFLQLKAHLVANILQTVGRSDREIAFLGTNLVTEVGKFLPRAVPMAFRAVNQVER